jgi:hypothetical protein
VKLFKLETPDLWLPDEINMMLVRATDEKAARHIARNHAAGEHPNRFSGDGKDKYIDCWLLPERATCEEIETDGNSAVVYTASGYN